jgi:nitrite reductase (NADH) large subunit
MKAVIIGNGIAGISAAEALRVAEPDPGRLDVEIHSLEEHDFYSRIRLPEVISAGLGMDAITLHKGDWYEKRSISVFRGHQAAAIRSDRKAVDFADGSTAPYDALLLCTGAEPMKFVLPGIDLDGVIALRSFEDAVDIRSRVERGARDVAVIGGGLLGIEAAHHIKKSGVETVVVVEIADRLLPRQIDEAGSAILRRILERLGLSFRLGSRVGRYGGEGRVESVSLASGEELRSDFVLLSSGIAPRKTLAAAAGIACGRGIIVDGFMETSVKGIFAAGDAAEFSGRVLGIIPAAIDQAQAAARAILGERSMPYTGTIPRTSLKVAGIDLLSVGLAVPEGEEAKAVETIVHEDAEAGRYEKFVMREGVLEGAIVLGSKKNQAWVNANIGKAINAEGVPGL